MILRLLRMFGLSATTGTLAAPPARNPDIGRFNEIFCSANRTLAKGTLPSLEDGIGILITSLPHAGEFEGDIAKAICFLRKAFKSSHRADTKGPWNWDLSSYGVIAWKNDLWDREDALRAAWQHIEKVNDSLKKRGLGWDY